MIHALQCTHYVILWHLAKVSEGTSKKVASFFFVHLLLSFVCVPVVLFAVVCSILRLFSIGEYGDSEEANEGILSHVPALPNKRQHRCQRAGLYCLDLPHVEQYI